MSEASKVNFGRVNGQTPMDLVARGASLAIILATFTLCNLAQAKSCPTNISISGPGVINYNSLSPSATTAQFTISGGAYSSTESYQRQVGVFKQISGKESEGVRYSFSADQGLTNGFVRNETISWAGSLWRGPGVKAHSARYGLESANVAPSALFTVSVPGLQKLSPGTHEVKFMAYATYSELDECMFNSGMTLPQEQLFFLYVPQTLELTLGGGSSTGTVDFGSDLATSAKRTVNLRLRSNISYQITLDSAFHGLLKLNNKPEALDQIVYMTTLNGRQIDEKTPFVIDNPLTSSRDDLTVPFEVTIGDTSNARAGFYKDTVKLTIASRP